MVQQKKQFIHTLIKKPPATNQVRIISPVIQKRIPTWQKGIKRFFDMVLAGLMLILLTPIYAYIAFRVWLSSPGPILYKQERIGYGGQLFMIYKFRSMYVDAERGGPQLSRHHDPRITPWGATMRKWRLDELPQFWNAVKGEMSLVGPRPERQFFIDQIVQRAPQFYYLLEVRPGITSWGQVKYGYASSINEMILRLRFDLYYLEHVSLLFDLKILWHTVWVLLQGKGK